MATRMMAFKSGEDGVEGQRDLARFSNHFAKGPATREIKPNEVFASMDIEVHLQERILNTNCQSGGEG